ncbi:MAG TPA: NAD(P)-dependent oxidoreductase [Ktedonobacteraceae bacterium]|jgi:3-hydroxyisobutyrate dehydrogenase-like beta-hydroxyacid dehydrogenase|nr:NAD(P)-dependent oxidoreductase [Ktedonobacteraceae bacterium]
MMSERIGFIGLGNMGRPMAGNLLKAGFDLRVYNRNPAKAEALVAQGAKQVSHPAEAVEPGGIAITMVANDAALEQVVLGENGLLGRLGSNGIHLSMSTISPATARKLADLHVRHGSTYVAAPVFGRPEAAAAQQLWINVSGPQAAKERVQPVLKALGQGIFDFGEEPGAANVVKLAGNFLVAAAMEAMAEALTLAEKNGIDRSQVIDMFGQTIFNSPIYRNYGKAIAQKRYTPAGFYLSLGLKDVSLVLQTANEAQMPMPFGSLLHDRFMSSIAKGRGEMDWSALALGVSEDAGLS